MRQRKPRSRRERPRGGPRDGRGDPAVAPAVSYVRLIACLRRFSEPVTIPELIRVLDLDRSAEPLLRRQLSFLEKEGAVFDLRRGRWKLHSRARLLIGRLACPRRGYGFVVPEDGVGDDLYVAGRRLHGGRHGDLVMARRVRPGRDPRDRPGSAEGEVIAILERRSPFVAGLFRGGSGGGIVLPRDERLCGEIAIDRPGEIARDGDVVWAEVTAPDDRHRPARGRIVSVLGPPEEPGVGVNLARKMFDLPGEFPREVHEEAQRRGQMVPEDEVARREDFRARLVVTVDPADARDHDDAVGVEVLSTARGRVFRLEVHIADVSSYVTQGGPTDREALRRGVSVYFPGQVIPMLPPVLSAGICSLLPDEDRLAQSVIMDFDQEGRRRAFRFADGVIRSRALLTYEQVGQMLAGRPTAAPPGVAEALGDMEKLCRLLRARRMDRGSLDMNIPETQVIVDAEGRPVDVRPIEHDIAHQMIEEFMLAANETVAAYLGEKLSPALYRIHEDPDPAGIGEVEDKLAAMGFPVRRLRAPASVRVRSLLGAFRGRPEERAVGMMVLRALKLARYSHEALGHFGLAAPLYTHFTSPIRRYPDLVVHRLLRETRRPGWTPPDGGTDPADRIAMIAVECSRLERRAAEAERLVVEWKEAIYMKDRVGAEYHGMVTGMTAESLFVTIEGLGVEGIIPGAARRAGRAHRWRLGDTLRVRVQSVDAFRGRVLLRSLGTG